MPEAGFLLTAKTILFQEFEISRLHNFGHRLLNLDLRIVMFSLILCTFSESNQVIVPIKNCTGLKNKTSKQKQNNVKKKKKTSLKSGNIKWVWIEISFSSGRLEKHKWATVTQKWVGGLRWNGIIRMILDTWFLVHSRISRVCPVRQETTSGEWNNVSHNISWIRHGHPSAEKQNKGWNIMKKNWCDDKTNWNENTQIYCQKNW